ncbi:MAG: AgmX/PglI C-terminal domain-containing protein [Kofleriaceae bacterium]
MIRATILILAATAIAHAEPQADVGELEISGRQDRLDDLNAIVRTQFSGYRNCFANSNDRLRVHVHLVVTPAGKVTGVGVAAPSVAPEIIECVRSVAKATVFKALTEKTHLDFVVTSIPTWMQSSGGAFASLTGTGEISSGFEDENIYGSGLLGNDTTKDGDGWSKIGTGKGKSEGVGTGKGKGGLMRHDNPTTSIGQPTVTGGLDKAIIRRYVKRNIQKILSCYETELDKRPKLAGQITAEFRIGVDGLVSASKASGFDKTVATCVAGVIKTIEFPKPQGGAVEVKYPFTFKQTTTE